MNQNKNDDLQMETRVANEIMQVVINRGLPLKLDRITPGQGKCFPIAIIDQCKRPEILSQLHPKIKSLNTTHK